MAGLLPWLVLLGAALLLPAWWRGRRAQVSELNRLRGLTAELEARVAAQVRAERHSLSGLPTREPLLAAIAAAPHGTLGVVALADFDRLATFDPALADRVLVALVERLQRMVAGRRLIAHVDRGQFALWFGPDTPADEARAEVAAIGYALGDAVPDGARHIVPSIDTAHARWPDDDTDPPALLARAISALALGSAAAGEGGVADAAHRARERYLLEQDLRQAIEQSEFHLAFQPLVDSDQERVVGAEALIRWSHPRRGLVSPSLFVPLAEEMGLADQLGSWALDAALREATGWPEPWRVAVNLSAHQLDAGDFTLTVGRTLARHAVDPSRLELELTETIAAADPARAAELFDELRALGIRIAIDDFGTGFSSFSAIRRLHFDKIKIDREFVTEVDRRRDSQAICRSIIALAHGLGIRVLAEGVERFEELDWLRRAGCSLFQGFYFAEPLAPAAFATFAAEPARLGPLLHLPSPQRLARAAGTVG
jgi:EAL domain-containing protein (putative c-di-GMP-specific phosphodiesterase class I)/GGDEF domain-containing protein